MHSTDYIRLIHQKLAGQIEGKEQEQLEQWLDADAKNQQLADEIGHAWDLTASFADDLEIDVERGLHRFKATLQTEEVSAEPSTKVFALSRPIWLWSAAAAIAVLVFSIWLWTNNTVINPDWVEVQTAEGEQTELALADGSIVWLNENSSLKASKSYENGFREVLLEGEAFFEVQRREDLPFVVKTGETAIKVLGTSFNVRSYQPDEEVEVSVKTGSVEVKAKERTSKWVLEKEDRLVLNAQKKQANLTKDQSFNALAWRSRQLSFRGTPMSDVIRDVSRCYGVDLAITNTDILDCTFSSNFKEVELEEVVQTIATSFGMEIQQQDDNSFKLVGGSCK
ncbi:MAG: FecR domain-containing protein [Bacteroidota bacterium]